MREISPTYQTNDFEFSVCGGVKVKSKKKNNNKVKTTGVGYLRREKSQHKKQKTNKKVRRVNEEWEWKGGERKMMIRKRSEVREKLKSMDIDRYRCWSTAVAEK